LVLLWIIAAWLNLVPPKEIELHPDAWARFERAADVVVKAPPQHRVAKKKAAKKSKPKKKAKA
jgi:hypothetical protein